MLPESVMKFLGQTEPTTTFTVERGAIEKYIDAVDDPNPLYWDEKFAEKSPYGSIIAPPGFFGWPPIMRAKVEKQPLPLAIGGKLADALAEIGYGRVVNGEMAFEFFLPVRPGEILTASPRIKSMVEREGRSGKMVFVTTERVYRNQKDETVAIQTHTTVHR